MKTIKSTQGFILPTVVMLSFICCLVVLHYLMLYTNDRHFLSETENNLYHNTLLQIGSIDSIEIIESNDTLEEQEGIMEYEAGIVQYEIIPQQDAVIYVHPLLNKVNEQQVFTMIKKRKPYQIGWRELNEGHLFNRIYGSR
ncbi:competence type IV pilus minor pilin ComGG [Bacillus taeanensis]|uniref:Competence protein ComG n=1 Tax=Bacillus taeanensis TaxID=273032 RepID=A0A366Y302_9BACI|nr:competence type IV pilus minor pilin ComGG [Bacillus taeanensis]RBW70581.1 hypothetical protein DS031_06070 [Bacillus taeanensis]